MSEALHDLEKLYAQLPPTVAEESEQRAAWEGLREEYIRTVRQALDHLGATLSSVGCTDAELSAVLEPETVKEETVDTEPDNEKTAEVPVPSWVKMGASKGALSPSDVPVLSGNGTEK